MSDKDLIIEFAREISTMADRMAEEKGWVRAFRAGCDATDPKGDTTVIRAIYRTMDANGILAMWPLRFGPSPLEDRAGCPGRLGLRWHKRLLFGRHAEWDRGHRRRNAQLRSNARCLAELE